MHAEYAHFKWLMLSRVIESEAEPGMACELVLEQHRQRIRAAGLRLSERRECRGSECEAGDRHAEGSPRQSMWTPAIVQ
jgi:hypothetical protein